MFEINQKDIKHLEVYLNDYLHEVFPEIWNIDTLRYLIKEQNNKHFPRQKLVPRKYTFGRYERDFTK